MPYPKKAAKAKIDWKRKQDSKRIKWATQKVLRVQWGSELQIFLVFRLWMFVRSLNEPFIQMVFWTADTIVHSDHGLNNRHYYWAFEDWTKWSTIHKPFEYPITIWHLNSRQVCYADVTALKMFAIQIPAKKQFKSIAIRSLRAWVFNVLAPHSILLTRFYPKKSAWVGKKNLRFGKSRKTSLQGWARFGLVSNPDTRRFFLFSNSVSISGSAGKSRWDLKNLRKKGNIITTLTCIKEI